MDSIRDPRIAHHTFALDTSAPAPDIAHTPSVRTGARRPHLDLGLVDRIFDKARAVPKDKLDAPLLRFLEQFTVRALQHRPARRPRRTPLPGNGRPPHRPCGLPRGMVGPCGQWFAPQKADHLRIPPPKEPNI